MADVLSGHWLPAYLTAYWGWSRSVTVPLPKTRVRPRLPSVALSGLPVRGFARPLEIVRPRFGRTNNAAVHGAGGRGGTLAHARGSVMRHCRWELRTPGRNEQNSQDWESRRKPERTFADRMLRIYRTSNFQESIFKRLQSCSFCLSCLRFLRPRVRHHASPFEENWPSLVLNSKLNVVSEP